MFSSARQNLYNRQHTFLETVRLSGDSVVLNFSPDTLSPGPFRLVYEFKAANGAVLQRHERDDFMVQNLAGKCDLLIPAPVKEYEITVMLDSALIYANSFQATDAPF
jgi:hypothetical protein